ncbi:uncharacterized protein SCHCODRAFT_02640024 [Schizophyllum commune H4-8]|uniref:uncharacterized protein n=1 Tax=Schizophyllum commune (strain H4-8 / FGSC 9210) TaxID=578458 RepID=UPI00215F406E|nr:uncharacterized protein SCHCODRAFT_02639986 [Schizophyllum commune H4-8]XP_050197843.1 uncharacterized protein SCHCODRAFT_02640024 [Schizophyllum commune H4-8]KAI5886843.1 hypothetical protein SCHCODRAFT_02639986 [Schizophyllum commune H4-8]KAI5886851.1 hypothetical protein SCHCODRAFT_02640024 [Schizophyllum commune H4-8]
MTAGRVGSGLSYPHGNARLPHPEVSRANAPHRDGERFFHIAGEIVDVASRRIHHPRGLARASGGLEGSENAELKVNFSFCTVRSELTTLNDPENLLQRA